MRCCGKTYYRPLPNTAWVRCDIASQPSNALEATTASSLFACWHETIRMAAAVKEELAQFVAEGLVVDLDGTLLDTEPLYYEAYARVATDLGRVYSFDVHRFLLGRAEVEGAGNFIRELELGLTDITPHQVLDRRDKYFLDACLHATPMPGAMTCLRSVHGRVPIAIATSSKREYLGHKRSNNESLFALVDSIVCGDDETVGGKSKPDPAIFLAGAGTLGVAPHRCAAIEDSIAGIISARAAGMYVIAVPDARLDMEEVLAANPHVIFKTLEEFSAATIGL